MIIPLSRPVINEEMVTALKDAIYNERLVGGKSVDLFEKEFADYVGSRYAVSVNSGTSALFLIMKAMGIKRGDIVITTSATFIATVNAISESGGTPLFVDIDKEDNNISVRKLEDALNSLDRKRVKAILPVHLYGRPADMDSILRIANEVGVPVIEDACQAHGAIYKARRAGSMGIASAFSFYTSKNMTVAGDGGMVVTNDEEVADKIRQLRNQGSSKNDKYLHERVGYNFRLNTINAAFGRVQLRHLDDWLNNRRKIVDVYNSKLKNVGGVVLPPNDDDLIRSAWHLFVIKTNRRDNLKEYLQNKSVETGIHYPIPVHMQPPYSRRRLLASAGLENTEIWSKNVLSLPIYNDMKVDDANFVAERVTEYFEGN